MSTVFRGLLQKVGSGAHTNKILSRSEAATALDLMLTQQATPAQIGAFLIAHRIRRPTAEELAGMLDVYQCYGPQLTPIAAAYPTLVMGVPYDGRSRTLPLAPLTALVLAAAGCPVIHHGAGVMPTKYGIPLVQMWEHLDVNWRSLSLGAVQEVFARTNLGFIYVPRLFPLVTTLFPYREQIGKRPPLATLELMWCPYAGESILAMGYVHPPTEGLIRGALALHQVPRYLLVKGLEGSPDLPRDRTAIIGTQQPGQDYDRLFLSVQDYELSHTNAPLDATAHLGLELVSVLDGNDTEVARSVIWNSGFYLWQGGVCGDMATGMALAKELLVSNKALDQLIAVQAAIQRVSGSLG